MSIAARVSILSLLPPLISMSFATAQPVRERVRVGVVRISLTAQTSSRRPVRDLKLEELSLRVDGEPVRSDSLIVSGAGVRAGTSVTPARGHAAVSEPAVPDSPASPPDP